MVSFKATVAVAASFLIAVSASPSTSKPKGDNKLPKEDNGGQYRGKDCLEREINFN